MRTNNISVPRVCRNKFIQTSFQMHSSPTLMQIKHTKTLKRYRLNFRVHVKFAKKN